MQCFIDLSWIEVRYVVRTVSSTFFFTYFTTHTKRSTAMPKIVFSILTLVLWCQFNNLSNFRFYAVRWSSGTFLLVMQECVTEWGRPIKHFYIQFSHWSHANYWKINERGMLRFLNVQGMYQRNFFFFLWCRRDFSDASIAEVNWQTLIPCLQCLNRGSKAAIATQVSGPIALTFT